MVVRGGLLACLESRDAGDDAILFQSRKGADDGFTPDAEVGGDGVDGREAVVVGVGVGLEGKQHALVGGGDAGVAQESSEGFDEPWAALFEWRVHFGGRSSLL